MALVYLFVYGTLKIETIEHVMPQLASCIQFVANGYVKGRLFDVDDYPGAVPSKEGQVFGELLSINDELAEAVLTVLDSYEDYREADIEQSLFRREKTVVYLSDTNAVDAFIYWYNKPVTGLNEMVEGIYSRNKR